MRRVLSICGILTFVAGASLSAQTLASHPFSFDATLGLSRGSGGEYFERGGPSIELTGIWGMGPHRIAGIMAGGRAALGHGDVCVFDATRTRCLDRFPSIVHVAPVVGLQTSVNAFAARAMVGPSVFVGSGNGFGAVARLDAAAGLSHIKLVAALNGAIDVRSHETLRLGELQFGFRFQ
jgi:hypothetical protein